MLESGNIDEPLIIFAVPRGILEDDITQVDIREAKRNSTVDTEFNVTSNIKHNK